MIDGCLQSVAQRVSSLKATYYHDKNVSYVGKFFKENAACKEKLHSPLRLIL